MTQTEADGQKPRWKIWKAVAVVLVVSVLVVSGLITVGWLVVPRVEASKWMKVSTLFDLIKIAFAVMAGAGGAVALVVAYRRQQVAEERNALDRAADQRAAEEHQRGAERLFHERFQKASEQLGHEAAAVRLAGVYAMASLADDWEDQRQTCIDVLCAYLRMHFNPEPPDDPEQLRAWKGERQVRQTVVRVIAVHLRELAPVSWRGHDLDFTGAAFVDGDSFVGVSFAGGRVSFAEARFASGAVSFMHAEFAGGVISFEKATFAAGAVSFAGAEFAGSVVSFIGARFTGGEVSFDFAEFTRNSLARWGWYAGQLAFDSAEFTGSKVSFLGAKFAHGIVDFRAPASWDVPPIFDEDVIRDVPEGLLLPEGWRPAGLSTVEGEE